MPLHHPFLPRLLVPPLLVLLATFAPAAGAQTPAAKPAAALHENLSQVPGALTGTTQATGAVAPAATNLGPRPATEAPLADPSPATAGDAWIRPEEIAEQADALTQRLEDLRPAAGEVAELGRIDAGITRLEADLNAALAQAKGALGGSTSLIAVQDARRDLESVARPLSTSKERLAADARRTADVLDEAIDAQQRWVATRNRPETAEAGEAVLKRADSSLALLRQFIAQTQAWRVQVLTLSDRLLDRSAAVGDAVRKLDGAAIAQTSGLIIPTHPPLWRRGLASQIAKELDLVPKLLGDFRQSTLEYFQLDSRPFLLQVFLALVLMFLLRDLPQNAQHRLRHAPETALILTRPYAIVLLLVLILSPALHPMAPQRVVQLLGLLALFPVARILMLARGHADLPLFAGLFVLFVINRLSIALSGLSALVLVAFLFQLALALILAAGYRRRLLAGGNNPSQVRVLTAAMYALTFAWIAQVGGWSSLAAVLGRGILAGGISALYLYTAIISLEALVAYGLATPAMRRSRFVDRNQALLHLWTTRIVRLVGAVYWVRLLLNALGVRSFAFDAIQAFLASGISIGQLSISIGGISAFVLTVVFARILSHVVHEVLEDEVFTRTNLPRGIPNALLTLTRYAIYSLGFLLALAAAGVQLGQLTILIGGLGVGIGLGLQDIVKNFAAGITLLLERRVHVGDAIQIPGKDVFGRVLSIGMRASVVRNWNGAEVVMPNDDLVSGAVTNLTLSDQMQRIDVPVGVAYGTDPAAVIALLLGVARGDKRLLQTPAPSAFFQGFGTSSLDFVLRAWTDEEYESIAERRSDLAMAVHAALRDAGIEIPFPQRDINLVRVSPQAGGMLKPA